MLLTFCCLYSGPNAEPDLYELFAFASEEPTFIGGDFNAHHEMWGIRGRTALDITSPPSWRKRNASRSLTLVNPLMWLEGS